MHRSIFFMALPALILAKGTALAQEMEDKMNKTPEKLPGLVDICLFEINLLQVDRRR